MLDLISIGGATRDIFFQIDSLAVKKSRGKMDCNFLEVPYGEKIVSDATYYSYGGGAVNVAVCGKRLGLSTASCCNIGREGTGSLVRAYLEEEGVNTRMVSRDSHLHTGLSVLVVGSDGEHTGFLERGANNHLCIHRWSPLKRTKWFYVSSLTGESAKILPQLFEFAVRHRIKVAFNPGSRQLAEGYHGLRGFLESTEILLLNLEEAQSLLFSKTKKHPKDEEELLFELAKMGPPTIVVTDANRGSYAICGGEIYRERSFSSRVIDTTGAGDCFGGTFVFGQIKGLGIQQSLRIATKNAASVVEKMGATAGLLRYNDLEG